jgi:DNA-binding beta-propeller fold protein YncE
VALRLTGHIDLPAHAAPGAFDHAAIHEPTRRLYVAHTANDAVDVIDCARGAFTHSLGGLPSVAGVLVDEARGLAFTSNRGEDTVGLFRPGAEDKIEKVGVGVRPNGLAFDSSRGTLLAANVGDPAVPGSFTLSVVDVDAMRLRGAIAVPGRTRWAIYDRGLDRFFVNIAEPARIMVVAGDAPTRIAATFEVPAVGPHGLELDVETGRLFCACDEGQLVALDAATGRPLGMVALSGAPDVIFLDPALGRLYVAVGDPGVIDVVDVRAMRRIETVPTEPGAHTTALDGRRHRLYVFLPATHRAAVFVDE